MYGAQRPNQQKLNLQAANLNPNYGVGGFVDQKNTEQSIQGVSGEFSFDENEQDYQDAARMHQANMM